MSKRLQVVMDDAEYQAFERRAEEQGVTLSEWVRQALRETHRRRSSGDVEAKLAAIDKAAALAFSGPAPDIDEMLAEIEAGYAEG